MRESLLLTFLVLLCYITASNPQQVVGVATPSRRSIDINSGGKTKNDFSKGDDGDSDNVDTVFDDSPEPIKFPTDSPAVPSTSPKPITKLRAQYDPSRWRKIPLRKLVELGNETNLSTFLNKYLANARVAKDKNTNEEYLTDQNGTMIVNSRDQKVIVTPGSDPQPASDFQAIPLGPSTRTGIISTRARTSLNAITEKDMPKMKAKQDISFSSCTPELTTVPVPITVEPYILVLPRCLRVERCGGCCLSEVMSCEPERSEKKEFYIKKLAYTGNSERPFEYVDDVSVVVDRHTSCKCQCKTKKEHCNKILHDYVENECSCVCKNKSEYEKCQNNPNKVWDDVNCMCLCRDTRVCSSGFYYNLNVCECQKDVTEVRRRKKKRDTPVTISRKQ